MHVPLWDKVSLFAALFGFLNVPKDLGARGAWAHRLINFRFHNSGLYVSILCRPRVVGLGGSSALAVSLTPLAFQPWRKLYTRAYHTMLG